MHSYFEGWYLKQQCGPHSLALIPAYHIDEYGNPSASIQIITPDGSDFAAFDSDSFAAQKDRFWVRIGKNVFSEHGMIWTWRPHGTGSQDKSGSTPRRRSPILPWAPSRSSPLCSAAMRC